MNRTLEFKLNHVSPTPSTLRDDRAVDVPAALVEVNLGQLFLQQYFDSFPSGAPKPDPSRFEYLELVSAADDFRFHAFVSAASTVKKRTISTEMGQAFCRLLLHDHFGLVYFAHLSPLLGKETHAAFEGMRIVRSSSGDVPDYLCAKSTGRPCIAEAKGSFAKVSFTDNRFEKWRSQFSKIRVLDRNGLSRSVKGFVVATRLVTDANSPKLKSCSYIEDPQTSGEPLDEATSQYLRRVVVASHYSRVFSKIGLTPIAAALRVGYRLTRQLSFGIPIWTCQVQPFQGREFIGGLWRTSEGTGPVLTDSGWQYPIEIRSGHLAFVGLELSLARQVVQATRDSWDMLDDIAPMSAEGLWSSELAWLRDGVVAAPADQFFPSGLEQL